MNFREYMELVDRNIEAFDREHLCLLLRSLARKTPEDEWEEFIRMVDYARAGAFAGDSTKKSLPAQPAIGEREVSYIRWELTVLREQFEKISEGVATVHATEYEDFSFGFWDPDWTYEYEDTEGIGDIYEEAYDLLLYCVNAGLYEEAVELFDLIVWTNVQVEEDGEIQDTEMGLLEMQGERLVSVNCQTLFDHGIYAVYQVTEAPRRAQRVYTYATSNPFIGRVSLEEMPHVGPEELDGLPAFWASWIELLLQRTGDEEERYLEETVLHQCTEEEMVETAHRASASHPALYLAVIRRLRGTNLPLARRAAEAALTDVDERYVMRGEIALAAAEIAMESGDRRLAERDWVEAFVSNPTPVNYLRVAVECENPAERLAELEKRCEGYEARSCIGANAHADMSMRHTARELQVRSLGDVTRMILRFLHGDFDAAMAACRSIKVGVGWTGQFVEVAVPLFLLLLLQGETLGAGCKAQLRVAMRAMHTYRPSFTQEYGEGLAAQKRQEENAGEQAEQADLEMFRRVFFRWKHLHPLLDAQAQDYLLRVEQLIDMRISDIVFGQHRTHYDEVAALAAALGEVRESRGDFHAKDRTLLTYRMTFPRHTSFHAALRRYGMLDTRKR